MAKIHYDWLQAFKPLYAGELFYSYKLDKSISHFRGVRSISNLFFVFGEKSYAASDLGLHYLHIPFYGFPGKKGLNLQNLLGISQILLFIGFPSPPPPHSPSPNPFPPSMYENISIFYQPLFKGRQIKLVVDSQVVKSSLHVGCS